MKEPDPPAERSGAPASPLAISVDHADVREATTAAVEATLPAPASGEPPERRFSPGDRLGAHEIIRLLGEGGMGAVYLARDTRLGRLSAIKHLVGVDARRGARFIAEARATAQLSHENIVALYDIGEHQGLPYMVLEYVKGRTLAEWLRGRPPLPPARAAELMLPVAGALVAAHEAGVVHRDLKPQNIMLTDRGGVKVLDFGIAKLLGDAEPAAGVAAPAHLEGAITQPGAHVGTVAYMSPEQWGVDTVDERTDLWAVGVMLFEMVTGEHPLAPISPRSLAGVWRLDLPMPSVRDRVPGIGKLGAVVDRCLIKAKVDRLGSARELYAELSAIARPRLAPDLDEGEAERPYAGLASFQERDAGRFFGREREVEQVLARLVGSPLLAIVGPSGAGKSSLVRAGVIPALKRGGEAWEAFTVRPGPRPLAALGELLLQHAWQRSTPSGDAVAEVAAPSSDRGALVDRLRREPGLLGVEVRARALRRREQILLFVDQLEEIFTLATAEERAAFLACLAGAADDPSSPVRVVVAVRQDYLDRIAGAQDALADLVSRGTLPVGPMDRADLRRALVFPAAAADHRFDPPELVEEMLDALSGAAAALPLLQFSAERLWEARDRDRRLLTEASYRAFGGVAGALAGHADSVLGAMSPAERRAARALFLRLVTPERTRAVAAQSEIDELGGGPELTRVLARLVDARLLTVEGARREESTVELVHESLIQGWPLLAGWLDEEQEDAHFRGRLRHAAREWEASGAAEGLLWRGEAAEQAQRWHARRGGDERSPLGPREQRYLLAVIAHADRSRRRRRQLFGGALVALSVVAACVSWLAIRAQREATRADAEAALVRAQKAETERGAARARNAVRMAAARERQADPTTVVALLREIEPGSTPHGWAALARWALGAGVARVVIPQPDVPTGVAVSPDGASIAVASADKMVRIFRADGRGEPVVLTGHTERVHEVTWSPDGKRLASASWDRTIRIWPIGRAGEPLVLRGHDDRVYAAAWSPDGERLASSSADKTVRVWNADGTGEPLVLRGHEDRVYAAAWSPDGKRLVTGSADKTVRVWSADGAGDPLVLRGHDDLVYTAVWSPDGQRIASASEDKTIRIWRPDEGGDPLVLRGHDDRLNSVAWSPDGRRLVSASVDKTLRLWSADGAGRPVVLRGHEGRVVAATWSPDGARVVSASVDRTVRVWDADVAGRPLRMRGHEARALSAAWSPDGGRIASGSADKTVRVWSADGAGDPLVLRGHEGMVFATGWSPDGRRIVSSSSDRTVRIWNADGTGDPLVLRGHGDNVVWAAWSPDGRRIASASADGTARIWSADGTGEPLVLRGHEGSVTHVAWSPDGARVATASSDKTARIWNADGTGAPLVLRGHDDRVHSIAWSPDGKRLATGSSDRTLRLFRTDGAGPPLVLRGHEGLAGLRGGSPWSPDGGRVVTHSDDFTARVWSADGIGEPLVLSGPTRELNTAAWSPDGTRIAVSSDDASIWIWSDLSPLGGPDDPRLWAATAYCPPVEVRRRLLDAAEEDARADLERCLSRVREAR